MTRDVDGRLATAGYQDTLVRTETIHGYFIRDVGLAGYYSRVAIAMCRWHIRGAVAWTVCCSTRLPGGGPITALGACRSPIAGAGAAPQDPALEQVVGGHRRGSQSGRPPPTHLFALAPEMDVTQPARATATKE